MGLTKQQRNPDIWALRKALKTVIPELEECAEHPLTSMSEEHELEGMIKAYDLIIQWCNGIIDDEDCVYRTLVDKLDELRFRLRDHAPKWMRKCPRCTHYSVDREMENCDLGRVCNNYDGFDEECVQFLNGL